MPSACVLRLFKGGKAMSDTPDRPSDLSRIFDEFLVRRQRGESPILDEYCQRFPDLAEQLRLHVRLYDALETVRPEGETTLRDHGVLPRIPGYEVEAVLGQGGAGVVFRARHLRLGRPVAIKMLLAGAYAGPTELLRFQLEAEAVAGFVPSERRANLRGRQSTRDGRISRWSSSMAAAWPRNSRPLPPLTQGARKQQQGVATGSLGRGIGRYPGGGGVRRSSRRHHSS